MLIVLFIVVRLPGFYETVPALKGSFAFTLSLKVNLMVDFVVPKS